MILAANKWVATATLICCLLVISCKDGGTPSSFSIGSPGNLSLSHPTLFLYSGGVLGQT